MAGKIKRGMLWHPEPLKGSPQSLTGLTLPGLMYRPTLRLRQEPVTILPKYLWSLITMQTNFSFIWNPL